MILLPNHEYRTRDGQTVKIERVSPSGYAAGNVGGRNRIWRPSGENVGPYGGDRGPENLDIDFYADCRSAPVIIDPWRMAYPTDWDGGEPRRVREDAP